MRAQIESDGGYGWLHVAGGAIIGLIPAWLKSKANERAAIAESVAFCLDRVNILEKRIDAKDSEISRLHDRIDAKDGQIGTLVDQLATAEHERDQFRRDLTETQHKVAALESQICPLAESDRPEICQAKKGPQ